MKSPAYLLVALVLVVLFSLIAYRVSVHFAVLHGAEPAPVAGEAGEPGTAEPASETAPAPAPATLLAREAIERAAPVQAAVEAYFTEQGDWPQSLAQLGLGVPGDHAGGPVAGIVVQQQGVVVVSTKPHVARGGTIQLSPRRLPDGGFEWRCRASNYPAATRLPDCR